jgi:HK97 family phage portal protein
MVREFLMKLFGVAPREEVEATPKRRSLENPTDFVLDALEGNIATSGVRVNATTSLQYSPIWACVSLISRDVAKLPIWVYKGSNGGGRAKNTRHAAHRLLHVAPNSWLTPFQFKLRAVWEQLLWGNHYSWIRSEGGVPVELLPLDPAQTSVERVDGAGKYFYRTGVDGVEGEVALLPHQVFHLRGMGDGLEGLTTYEKARDSFGMGLATQAFANKFFYNGARSQVAFTHPGELEGTDAGENLRRSIRDRMQGLDNAWMPWVLEEGMEAKVLGMSNEDAQLQGLMSHGLIDIANWFGMPAGKIGAQVNTSYGSLEAEEKAYLGQTIDPHLVNFEEEALAKLFTEKERRSGRWTVEFDRKKLQRTSLVDQSTFLQSMVANGVMNRDEAREQLGMNPIEDGSGESYLVPLNLTDPTEPDQDPPAIGDQNQEPDTDQVDVDAARAAVQAALELTLDSLVHRLVEQGASRMKARERLQDWLCDDIAGMNDTQVMGKLRPLEGILRALGGKPPQTRTMRNRLYGLFRDHLTQAGSYSDGLAWLAKNASGTLQEKIWSDTWNGEPAPRKQKSE